MNWSDAATLADLGELTALWLLGEIDGHPENGAESPDAETSEISEHLVEFNRSSFVTYFSQPAYPDQRASVGGWCDFETAKRLLRLTVEGDLIVLVDQPAIACSYTQIPITRVPGGSDSHWSPVWRVDDGDTDGAYTWMGAFPDDEYIDHVWGDAVPPAAVSALKSAWKVELIDPVWGREDALWQAMRRVLGGR